MKESKIYKLVSPYTTKVYVGSTCQPLKNRLSSHKSDFKKGATISSCQIFKFGSVSIEILEKIVHEKKQPLLIRERFWIEKLDSCNKNIPYRTQDEFNKIKREYRIKYHSEHKEYYRNYSKQYRLDHPEESKAYNKKYYAESKKKTQIKIKCDCGGSYQKYTLKRHLTSKKHIKYVDTNCVIII